MKKILLIEDDIEYAAILSQILEYASYDVTHVKSSSEALSIIKDNNFDLILCDLYLDNINGNQLIEMLRMYKPELKSLMISNSTDFDDELNSLKFGADDFVRKNTSFEIILARIQNAIGDKRAATNLQKLYSKVEDIEVDRENRLVKKNGEVIHLTTLEFDLLVYMLKNKKLLLSREQILEEVWKLPPDSLTSDLRTIDAHVKNLRSKLKISSIFSIRGIGYRWYE